MTAPQPQSEPTITDVMAELKDIKSRLHLTDIETRTRDVELRANIAELRLDMDTRFGDVFRRLDTLFEELVAFRAEYNQHTHDD